MPHRLSRGMLRCVAVRRCTAMDDNGIVHCTSITFERFDAGISYFSHPLCLQAVCVKYVYEDYQIKLKITGAKKVDNAYSHNVKLQAKKTPLSRSWKISSQITPRLYTYSSEVFVLSLAMADSVRPMR